MGEPFSYTRNGKLRPLSSCTQMPPDPRDTVLSLVSTGFAARGRIHGNLWISHLYAGWRSQPASWIRERIPFVFLGVKNCLVFFLTFPYPVSIPKNFVIFISLSIRPSYGGGGRGDEKGRPDTKTFSKCCDTFKIWTWQWLENTQYLLMSPTARAIGKETVTEIFHRCLISCYRYVILLQTETRRGIQKGSTGRS